MKGVKYTGGGPISDALAYKAVWQAGYRGTYFGITMTDSMTLTLVMPAEVLEGFISGAWPTEFEPALNQQAKDLKQAWIAKYGKWEAPDCGGSSSYPALVAALQQAGSLDTDKVAAVFSNGLKYESPCGSGQMVSRPDLGNNRTVDSVVDVCMRQVKGGKLTAIDNISLDDAIKYFQAAFPPAQGK